ncbi:MAG: hypothetical protein IPK64_18945 [bacterium]|nr:hypothetical protein [bacterium]
MFNRHKKFAALAFILGGLLLALAACQDGPAEPVGASDKALASPRDTVDRRDPAYIQARLAEMWAESDLTQYESFIGTIDVPAFGGLIEGTVPSWPGCNFRIEFAPGVLDGSLPRTFRMSVPVPNASTGVYYQFEEVGGGGGGSFHGKARVTIHWPLIKPRKPGAGFYDYISLSCLNRTDRNHDGVYEYSRSDEVTCLQPDRLQSKLVFDLPHFSRWSMQNGKVGEP